MAVGPIAEEEAIWPIHVRAGHVWTFSAHSHISCNEENHPNLVQQRPAGWTGKWRPREILQLLPAIQVGSNRNIPSQTRIWLYLTSSIRPVARQRPKERYSVACAAKIFSRFSPVLWLVKLQRKMRLKRFEPEPDRSTQSTHAVICHCLCDIDRLASIECRIWKVNPWCYTPRDTALSVHLSLSSESA